MDMVVYSRNWINQNLIFKAKNRILVLNHSAFTNCLHAEHFVIIHPQ